MCSSSSFSLANLLLILCTTIIIATNHIVEIHSARLFKSFQTVAKLPPPLLNANQSITLLIENATPTIAQQEPITTVSPSISTTESQLVPGSANAKPNTQPAIPATAYNSTIGGPENVTATGRDGADLDVVSSSDSTAASTTSDSFAISTTPTSGQLAPQSQPNESQPSLVAGALSTGEPAGKISTRPSPELGTKLAPSASTFHPLLIYSIRFEIKSYDLFGGGSSRAHSYAASKRAFAPDLDNFNAGQQQLAHPPARTLIAGLKNTIGLDFYISDTESYIFWTDVVEERIYRGTMVNGTITNTQIVIQTGLATAEGLAIDWVGLNIYWVESTLDHIEVANMNGTSRRTLIAGDMESPRAIALDPLRGLMFWTDWDKRLPRIERATMSGDDRRTLVYIKEIGGGWPNGLTLDYDALKIYWIDANSDSIHVVDYEGNNHRQLLCKQPAIKSLGHPFSITLFENNLYWTDWKTNTISTASKHNGSQVRELQRLTNRLFDIKVFHPSRQPKMPDNLNPCHLNNGHCSHLCLLSTNHTRKCDCPHLMKLAPDDKTCETDERVLIIGRTNEIRAVDISKPLHYIMAPISVPRVFSPKQFEFDVNTRTIYWADSQTNEVKRAQLAGTSIDTVIDVIIDSPSGLALDWISRNIYVTSAAQLSTPGKIFISNLDGEYISVLMDSSQGIYSPKSLAIHPILGMLFCLDENEFFKPIIFVATMDGKNKRVIASKENDPSLENPSNLAIDLELNRVYWINQANRASDNATIQYYDITRDEIITIFDESEVPQNQRINPGVLCVDGDYLIISSRNPNEAIMRVSKHNMTDYKSRTVLKTQSLDQISALKVYNTSTQVGSNACSYNNGNCSQLCVPTNSTHRTCRCTMGYNINPTNQVQCIGKDLFLIFSYNFGMKGISIEPDSSPNDYFMPPIHKAFRASSIDFDYRNNLIYWVDNEEGSITRINRDTTNYHVVIQGLESEECIAIDWVAGNIYWLDPYYHIIEVSRLNGSNRYVIVSGDMDKANGLAVNPLKGYIVWADIGSMPKIETAKLDGTNRRVIVSSNLSHVDDIAIDYVDDYIYWVDSTLALIERIRENGTERQVVYNGANHQNPHHHLVSIALYRDYLYVADSAQNHGSIIRLHKNNASNQRIIQQHLGDGIRDISIFASQSLPSEDENPCVTNNGGCQDLCLFAGKRGKKRCICSHGKLNTDGLTCKPFDTFILFSKSTQIDSLHIQDDESYNNSPYPPIAIENRSNIISLTVDYSAQRVIYSEITRNQICSVYFNGTDRRVLVEKQSFVEGIAFANDQLYWTSIQDISISRLNTSSLGVAKQSCDAKGCRSATVEKIIKLSGNDKPRGIAVDSCTSYIYWTNWNANASIQRAGPHDGYKIESIIKTDIKVPNGIVIDQRRRKLYWCDARLDKIETCDMDGTNRKILISESPQHPFALAVWKNYVFWTDWLARGVFRADKYTGQDLVQIKKVSQRPMGIAVAATETSECPHDHCSISNGGCPMGYTCVSRDTASGKPHIECREPNELDHNLSLPSSPECLHIGSSRLCNSSYHRTIMDTMERFSELAPREPQSGRWSAAVIPSHRTISSVTNGPAVQANGAPSAAHSSRSSWGPSAETTSTRQQTIQPSAVGLISTTAGTTTTTTTAITTTRPRPTEQTYPNHSVELNGSGGPTSTTSAPLAQVAGANSSLAPCQTPVPATGGPQPTTDGSASNDCNANQFKCYLAEKLVCIPKDRRCDGNLDCPSREDENDCYLSKRGGQYNLKHETNWYRFVPVILFILSAALFALFMVFGGRGRRRWFLGTSGPFTHRKMFDDNGTNIEISNPMFDDDDSTNLVNCAFSIDLNERTTNFSNPLYERQVLLVNDKNATAHRT